MVILLTVTPLTVNLLYLIELKSPYHFPWAHPCEDGLRIFPQTNAKFPFFPVLQWFFSPGFMSTVSQQILLAILNFSPSAYIYAYKHTHIHTTVIKKAIRGGS